MDISNHPIWQRVTPYKTKIESYKKPFHLLRIQLAKQYIKIYSRDKFIGITGSVGKTTTLQSLKEVLSLKYRVLATKPSLDPILNVPITLLKVNPMIDKVLLEMGIEYPGDMDFYLSLVKPKTAVVTRIFYAHSEYLGSVDEIIKEKGKIVEQIPEDGVAILNWDDINCRKLSEICKGKVFYFGKDPQNCHVWAGNVKIENFRTTFELNYGVERVKVEYQLLGEHQIYSALAAATLGVIEGIPLTRIKRGLETIKPSDHRLQQIEGPNGSLILDDTYNSSPAAAEAAIDLLGQLPARRRIIVFGEMRELGGYSEKMHRQLARKIYQEKVDMVYLGTGDANIIADELLKLGFWEEKLESNLQNPQIVSKLLKVLAKGDICLIKGSRGVRLDEVVKRIAKK